MDLTALRVLNIPLSPVCFLPASMESGGSLTSKIRNGGGNGSQASPVRKHRQEHEKDAGPAADKDGMCLEEKCFFFNLLKVKFIFVATTIKFQLRNCSKLNSYN